MRTSFFIENPAANRLARWAKLNPKTARTIIVVGHFAAFFACFWVGKSFFERGLELPRPLFFGLAALVAAAVSAYPFRKKGGSATAFRLDRAPFDVLLIGLFLAIGIVCGNGSAGEFGVKKPRSSRLSNAFGTGFLAEKSAPNLFSETVPPGLAFSIFDQKAAALKAEKAQNRWLEKAQKLTRPTRLGQKIARFAHQKMEPEKANSPLAGLWLGLTIVLVLILEWLLLVLSCSLACNSMGALAAIVLVGGAVGLFFGVFAISRRLFPQMKKSWHAWLAAGIVFGPVLIVLLLSGLDGLSG